MSKKTKGCWICGESHRGPCPIEKLRDLNREAIERAMDVILKAYSAPFKELAKR